MTLHEEPLDVGQLLPREAEFFSWLDRDRMRPEVVWYLNPFTLARLRRGELPFDVSDHVVADGRLMARSVKQATGKTCHSLHFDYSGLAAPTFERLRKSARSLAVIGGAPGEAVIFAEVLARKHPGLRIVFTRDGYFTSGEREGIVAEIDAAAPDLLLVAMGTPHQEQFAAVVRATARAPMAIVTCGGFVTQTAARPKSYYPDLVVHMNLRWLFRLFHEPRMHARVVRYYLPFMARKRFVGLQLPFRS